MSDYQPPFCIDCGAGEGCLHLLGCQMEICPKCLGKFIFCPSGCYIEDEEWDGEFEQVVRIPWLDIPLMCGLCGEQWSDFFKVTNEEWKAIVPPNLQKKILCKQCYERLKALWKVRGRDGWQVKMVSTKAGNE